MSTGRAMTRNYSKEVEGKDEFDDEDGRQDSAIEHDNHVVFPGRANSEDDDIVSVGEQNLGGNEDVHELPDPPVILPPGNQASDDSIAGRNGSRSQTTSLSLSRRFWESRSRWKSGRSSFQLQEDASDIMSAPSNDFTTTAQARPEDSTGANDRTVQEISDAINCNGTPGAYPSPSQNSSFAARASSTRHVVAYTVSEIHAVTVEHVGFFIKNKIWLFFAFGLALLVIAGTGIFWWRTNRGTERNHGPGPAIDDTEGDDVLNTAPTPVSLVVPSGWILSQTTPKRGTTSKVQLGASIAMSKDGSTVAVGIKNVPSDNIDGRVSVFRLDDGNLESMGYSLFVGPDSMHDVYVGGGLGLSRNGTRMAVGIDRESSSLQGTSADTKVGSVAVYDYVDAFPSWSLVGSDPIRGISAGEKFGHDVAISSDGSIVAVSAPRNADNGPDAGAVRVFRISEDGMNWVQMGGDLRGNSAGDQFGTDMSIASNGLTLAVGAPQVPRGGTGEVRIFTWNNSTEIWAQVGDAILGEKAMDQFGFGVSFSGDGSILAIGAPFHDNGRGRVSFLSRASGSAGSYELFGRGYPLEGNHVGDRFGHSVDLSDDGMTCVVGVPFVQLQSPSGKNETEASCCGHVAVFQYHDSCMPWVQKGQQTWGDASNDDYGWKVRISGDGNTFIASAPNSDSDEVEDSGELRLYYWEDGNAWEQIGQTMMGSQYQSGFGWSIGLSSEGNRVAIGAGCASSKKSINSGYAEVYRFENNHWELENRLNGTLSYGIVGFGIDLSGDGSTLVIGSSEGQALIMSLDEDKMNWMSTSVLEVPSKQPPREICSIELGTAVAMSDDGLIVAAGAWSSVDIGYAVAVFRRETESSTIWSPMGSPIFAPDSCDGMGSSVALSADGLTVAAACGATEEFIVQDGQVLVYTYNEEQQQWEQVANALKGLKLEAPYSLLRIALNSNGTVVAVGSYIMHFDRHSHNNGTVSLYQLSSDKTEWVQLGESMTGSTVALRDTSDGLVLALGIPFHEYVDTPDCFDRGLIRVLLWEESTMHWQQIGDDIIGEKSRDTLGNALALSEDGKILAAAGVLSGDFLGIVRVFQLASKKGPKN